MTPGNRNVGVCVCGECALKRALSASSKSPTHDHQKSSSQNLVAKISRPTSMIFRKSPCNSDSVCVISAEAFEKQKKLQTESSEQCWGPRTSAIFCLQQGVASVRKKTNLSPAPQHTFKPSWCLTLPVMCGPFFRTNAPMMSNPDKSPRTCDKADRETCTTRISHVSIRPTAQQTKQGVRQRVHDTPSSEQTRPKICKKNLVRGCPRFRFRRDVLRILLAPSQLVERHLVNDTVRSRQRCFLVLKRHCASSTTSLILPQGGKRGDEGSKGRKGREGGLRRPPSTTKPPASPLPPNLSPPSPL